MTRKEHGGIILLPWREYACTLPVAATLALHSRFPHLCMLSFPLDTAFLFASAVWNSCHFPAHQYSTRAPATGLLSSALSTARSNRISVYSCGSFSAPAAKQQRTDNNTRAGFKHICFVSDFNSISPSDSSPRQGHRTISSGRSMACRPSAFGVQSALRDIST